MHVPLVWGSLRLAPIIWFIIHASHIHTYAMYLVPTKLKVHSLPPSLNTETSQTRICTRFSSCATVSRPVAVPDCPASCPSSPLSRWFSSASWLCEVASCCDSLSLEILMVGWEGVSVMFWMVLGGEGGERRKEGGGRREGREEGECKTEDYTI